MMKCMIIALGLLSTTTFAGVLSVRDLGNGKERVRYEIPMNPNKVIGQGGQTIKLKTRMNNMSNGLRLPQSDMVRVILRAKSKNGGGKVFVKEGNYVSREKGIDRHKQGRGFRAAGGFNTISLVTPRERTGGVWQMRLTGRIMAKNIIVVFDRPKRRVQGNRSATCTKTLEDVFGKDYGKFTAKATAPTKKEAKRKACAKAKRKCEGEIKKVQKGLGDLGGLFGAVLTCDR